MYISLVLHLCSLSVCMTLIKRKRTVQDLLAFIVSGEKSGVILIGLPLYVTWHFSLTALMHALVEIRGQSQESALNLYNSF